MTGARPTLVVLGGGPAQQHAIDAAHALGVRTVVCDSEPGLGDATVSSEDAAGVLRVAAEAGADGLIAPGTDWPVRVAAEVAAKLGLPHPLTPTSPGEQPTRSPSARPSRPPEYPSRSGRPSSRPATRVWSRRPTGRASGR